MVKDGEDNTDYKQRNWKIEARLFKLFNRDVAPLSVIGMENRAGRKDRGRPFTFIFSRYKSCPKSMGVFCGQNFEREYIDVLSNKLLLCVIIQIRK